MAGRLDIRVQMEPYSDLEALVSKAFEAKVFHLAALFDESSITVRRRSVERPLPMSPFCIRHEIKVDRFFGSISLVPHPGEPPFSEFVAMVNELEGEQRDNAMVASADADALRGTVDRMLLGEPRVARWLMLADRALPPEVGMKSVRLLERKEHSRQVLLGASDYGRLAALMRDAFSDCNLSVTADSLAVVLKEGVNLVGSGLLEMIKTQSGMADNAKVVGFVGMLLAARDLRQTSSQILISSVDDRIARLWLRLGTDRGGERCDLLAVRRDDDGAIRLTCIEVKTSKNAELAEESEVVEKAVSQIKKTAEVLVDAIHGDSSFAPPRVEMLKRVLVRAASNRTLDDVRDEADRKVWGGVLKDLFSDNPPEIRIDGEVAVVKLRSSEAPSRAAWRGASAIPVTIRHITESLADELIRTDRPPADTPGAEPPGSGGGPGEADVRGSAFASTSARSKPTGVRDPAVRTFERRVRQDTVSDAAASTTYHVVEGLHPALAAESSREQGPRDGGPLVSPADDLPEHGLPHGVVWPPVPNALGIIGHESLARELDSQARKAVGWNERFGDKLFVGPAGVGKTTLAIRIAERLLRIKPIVFNGADLRRPEMITDKLVEEALVPEGPTGEVRVLPCLIFIDEVHAITATVSTVLLSALDERRKTTIDNVTYEFCDVVFMLATTDPGALTEAFRSRPDRVELPSYSLEEMAGIVWAHAKDRLDGGQLTRDACIEIAAGCQCNPRPSVNILKDLISHFYGMAERVEGRVPTKAEVAARMTAESVGRWFREARKIDGNGLGEQHIQYLRLLVTRGGAAESEIRQNIGIANRNDFVQLTEYLTRLGLVETSSSGRRATSDGRKYLREPNSLNLRERISRRSG